jgi:hypothetical protein
VFMRSSVAGCRGLRARAAPMRVSRRHRPRFACEDALWRHALEDARSLARDAVLSAGTDGDQDCFGFGLGSSARPLTVIYLGRPTGIP